MGHEFVRLYHSEDTRAALLEVYFALLSPALRCHSGIFSYYDLGFGGFGMLGWLWTYRSMDKRLC